MLLKQNIFKHPFIHDYYIWPALMLFSNYKIVQNIINFYHFILIARIKNRLTIHPKKMLKRCVVLLPLCFLPMYIPLNIVIWCILCDLNTNIIPRNVTNITITWGLLSYFTMSFRYIYFYTLLINILYLDWYYVAIKNDCRIKYFILPYIHFD